MLSEVDSTVSPNRSTQDRAGCAARSIPSCPASFALSFISSPELETRSWLPPWPSFWFVVRIELCAIRCVARQFGQDRGMARRPVVTAHCKAGYTRQETSKRRTSSPSPSSSRREDDSFVHHALRFVACETKRCELHKLLCGCRNVILTDCPSYHNCKSNCRANPQPV